MSIGKSRRSSAPTADDRPAVYFGFGWLGQVIVSDQPVDNRPTDLWRRLSAEIATELLSPCDVVDRVRQAETALAAVFSLTTMRNWSTASRFDLWPSVSASRSLEESLRSFRGSYPWLRPSPEWRDDCLKAENRYGYSIPRKPFDLSDFQL